MRFVRREVRRFGYFGGCRDSRWGSSAIFIKELKDLGRASAKAWLRKHYNAVGLRSTLDLRAAYS